MPENKNLTAIVIPVYAELPTALELVALKQCFSIFKDHSKFFLAPEHLNLEQYFKTAGGIVNVVRFSNDYFNLEGYNKLLLSACFYEKFTAFEYILIYQLDSYVFRDDLQTWSTGRYDYVGAPWISAAWLRSRQAFARRLALKNKSIIEQIVLQLRWLRKGYYFKSNLSVGNGGFSIRKVKCFLMISSQMQPQDFWSINEDVFWGIYVPLNYSSFRVSSPMKAAGFSFDINPSLLYKIKGRLPMGCHAWSRSDPPYEGNMQFYKKFIPALERRDNLTGISHESS